MSSTVYTERCQWCGQVLDPVTKLCPNTNCPGNTSGKSTDGTTQ